MSDYKKEWNLKNEREAEGWQPPTLERNGVIAMRLDTIPGAREELAKMIEAKRNATMSDMDFRILAYGMQTLLTYLKAERDGELEARIEAIEEALEQGDV